MSSQEKLFLDRTSRSNFCSVSMNFADLLVVLCFLLFAVEKLKESLRLSHAVRVPLLQLGGERIVSKEILRMYVAGRAAAEPWRGRAVLVKSRKHREFNPTRGYSGQDILPLFSAKHTLKF